MTALVSPLTNGARPAAAPAPRKSALQLLLHRPVCGVLGLRAITRDDLERKPAYHPRPFGSPETVKLDSVATVGEHPPHIAESFAPLEATLGAPFVSEVRDAELCGSRAVGFASPGRVILETTTPLYKKSGHLAMNLSLRCIREHFRRRSRVPHVDLACSLHNEWSSNYYHWVIDSLTRLEGVEHYASETGEEPLIIVRHSPSQMQLDSLRLMGFNEERLLRWNKQRLRVRRLVVSPYRRQFVNGVYNVCSARALRYVAARVKSNLPPASADVTLLPKRIYISRRLAQTRRVVNEEAVIAALEPLGFTAMTLESLTFAEQVRLFSQAECMVGPHGAGMTNLMFGERLKVVEFFGPEAPRCYSVKARALGFSYGFLRYHAVAGDRRGQDADFTVDVPQMRGFVEQQLSGGAAA